MLQVCNIYIKLVQDSQTGPGVFQQSSVRGWVLASHKHFLKLQPESQVLAQRWLLLMKAIVCIFILTSFFVFLILLYTLIMCPVFVSALYMQILCLCYNFLCIHFVACTWICSVTCFESCVFYNIYMQSFNTSILCLHCHFSSLQYSKTIPSRLCYSDILVLPTKTNICFFHFLLFFCFSSIFIFIFELKSVNDWTIFYIYIYIYIQTSNIKSKMSVVV